MIRQQIRRYSVTRNKPGVTELALSLSASPASENDQHATSSVTNGWRAQSLDSALLSHSHTPTLLFSNVRERADPIDETLSRRERVTAGNDDCIIYSLLTYLLTVTKQCCDSMKAGPGLSLLCVVFCYICLCVTKNNLVSRDRLKCPTIRKLFHRRYSNDKRYWA